MLQQVQSTTLYLITAFLTFVVCFCLLNRRENSCVLLITGESIRLVGCDLNKDLLEAVATLKPLGHL
uniref:Movement protein TGBp3 n=1 Tax=Potato virus S TaxID=12169 RepID=A0A2P1E972_9VIRU|nr:TGB3 [Potato virus S]